MTPEMAFECVFVSTDKQVLSDVTRLLDRLSVDLKICTSPTRAIEQISRYNADLVVFDWKEDRVGTEFLNAISRSDHKRKPVIVTIADNATTAASALRAGAHVIMHKPITPESGSQSLRSAYSKLVREERRNARVAVMKFVPARTEAGQYLPITVTDVSERGLGFLTKQPVEVGDRFSCDLLLPHMATPIHIEARVIWVQRDNWAGADFERVSAADLRLLYGWLAKRELRVEKQKQTSLEKK